MFEMCQVKRHKEGPVRTARAEPWTPGAAGLAGAGRAAGSAHGSRAEVSVSASALPPPASRGVNQGTGAGVAGARGWPRSPSPQRLP